MFKDKTKSVMAKTNFDLLCDVFLLMALAYLLVLLETIYSLVKLNPNKFVSTNATTIKVCQFHIRELCNDLTMSFHSNAFKDFKDLNYVNMKISM
jgi:hypothetical protein